MHSGDDESEREAKRRSQVRSFWLTGRQGLTIGEAAEVIVSEARELLSKDLGVQIDWTSAQEREKSLVSAASANGNTFATDVSKKLCNAFILYREQNQEKTGCQKGPKKEKRFGWQYAVQQSLGGELQR